MVVVSWHILGPSSCLRVSSPSAHPVKACLLPGIPIWDGFSPVGMRGQKCWLRSLNQCSDVDRVRMWPCLPCLNGQGSLENGPVYGEESWEPARVLEEAGLQGHERVYPCITQFKEARVSRKASYSWKLRFFFLDTPAHPAPSPPYVKNSEGLAVALMVHR